MINEAIDAYQHNAPFGAKGVGESSTMPVSPAIANAIDDAVGVRLDGLPLTPEAVFRALRETRRTAAGRRLRECQNCRQSLHFIGSFSADGDQHCADGVRYVGTSGTNGLTSRPTGGGAIADPRGDLSGR